MITIAVSGGFDPLHSGHLSLFNDAKFGLPDITKDRRLIVILNTDQWLANKKGKPFMPYLERSAVIYNLRAVDSVFMASDKDGTVAKSLSLIMPDYFVNGGDRGKEETPEDAICKTLGIETIYNVGGLKTQSSSEIISNFYEKS